MSMILDKVLDFGSDMLALDERGQKRMKARWVGDVTRTFSSLRFGVLRGQRGRLPREGRCMH